MYRILPKPEGGIDLKVSVISTILEGKIGKENISVEPKEEKTLDNNNEEEKNYYLEREIEELKKKWSILRYVDTKFNVLGYYKEQIKPQTKVEIKDIKDIKMLKKLLFNK